MTLEEWESRWVLNGDHLHCACCKVAQWPWNSAQPFQHAADCPALGTEVDHPWRDLARIVIADRAAQ